MFVRGIPICNICVVISKLRAMVAQWVKCWPTDLAIPSLNPARGEFFSAINEVLLHTAFHYHQSVVLI